MDDVCVPTCSSTSPIEHVLEEIGFGRFQWHVLLVCSLGYFGVCSELLLTVFLEDPLMDRFGLSTGDYAWLPFTVSLCTGCAAFAVGKVADLCGRKQVFIASLGLMLVAGMACATCQSFPLVILCRSIVGFGLGGLQIVAYVTFQEFSPPGSRRRYVNAVFAAGCLGVLYLATIVVAFPGLSTVDHWQWLVMLAALPLVPGMALRQCMSLESPFYLASKGRTSEAYEVLRHIAKTNGAEQCLPFPEEDFVRAVENTSPQPAQSGHSGRGSWTAVVGHSPRMTVPLSLIWFLQSTAYWGLTLFLPHYFKGIGVAPNRTIFLMVACELPGVGLTMLLVDHPKAGHVTALRANYCVATVATFAMVIVSSRWPVWIAPTLACLIYFSLIPNQGVLNMHAPEAYPTELRATALGCLQGLQHIPAMGSPFVSARLVQQGDNYMLAWGGCLLLALAMSMFLTEIPRISAAQTRAPLVMIGS